MSALLAILFAVSLNSSKIGEYWLGLSHDNTASINTIGSDDFVLEDHFAVTKRDMAAYYAVMDKFYKLDTMLSGARHTTNTVDFTNFNDYDTFLACRTRARNLMFPYAGVFGGKAFDKTFSRWGEPFESVGSVVMSSEYVKTHGKGWWPTAMCLSNGTYIVTGGPNCPVYSTVFDDLEYGDLDEYLQNPTNQLIDKTMEDLLDIAYLRFDVSQLVNTNKILSLRAVDTTAKMLGVIDEYYHHISNDDIVMCTNLISRNISGTARGSGNCSVVEVTNKGVGDIEVDVVSNPSISYGGITYDNSIIATTNECSESCPRIRISKPTATWSSGGVSYIGTTGCSVSDATNKILNAMGESTRATITFTASGDGNGGVLNVNGTNIYTDQTIWNVTDTGVLTTPSSISCGVYYRTDEMTCNNTTNVYFYIAPSISKHLTSALPYYSSVFSLISRYTDMLSKTNSIPSIDEYVEYDSDLEDMTRLYYSGGTATYVSKEWAAVNGWSMQTYLALIGEINRVYGTYDYTNACSLCKITSADFNEWISRAKSSIQAAVSYGGPITETCVVSRSGSSLVVESGTFSTGATWPITVTWSMSAPDVSCDEIPACGIDTKIHFVDRHAMDFGVLMDCSNGNVGGDTLKYTTATQNVARSASAFVGNKNTTTLNGDDPVFAVQEESFKKAFQGSEKLATVNFNKCTDVDKYGFNEAFSSCDKLGTLNFDGLLNVGRSGFEKVCYGSFDRTNGYAVASFEMLTNAQAYAFKNAFSIDRVLTPSQDTVFREAHFPSLTICGEGAFETAFYNCTNMTECSFPWLEECESRAFYNAFNNCKRLSNIFFPLLEDIDSKDIFENAFHGCSGITNVCFYTLGTCASDVFTNAFANTDKLASIDFSLLRECGDRTFFEAFKSDGDDDNLLKKVAFTNLTACGENAFNSAFAWRRGLEEAEFPNLLNCPTSAFNNAFFSCDALARIDFSSLTNADASAFLGAFTGCEMMSNVSFNCLQRAGDGAFDGAFFDNYRIENASFSNLVSVGVSSFAEAFDGCTWLKTVNFQSLTNAPQLSFHMAFKDAGLESVDFSSLETIPSGTRTDLDPFHDAFDGCLSITNVDFRNLQHTYSHPVFETEDNVVFHLENIAPESNVAFNISNCTGKVWLRFDNVNGNVSPSTWGIDDPATDCRVYVAIDKYPWYRKNSAWTGIYDIYTADESVGVCAIDEDMVFWWDDEVLDCGLTEGCFYTSNVSIPTGYNTQNVRLFVKRNETSEWVELKNGSFSGCVVSQASGHPNTCTITSDNNTDEQFLTRPTKYKLIVKDMQDETEYVVEGDCTYGE